MNLLPTFFFRERMAGTHDRSEPAQPFHFDLSVNCLDVEKPFEEIVGQCRGRLTMAGLAEDTPAEGTIELAPFSKKVVRYALSFRGADGRPYRFVGEKQINWLRPVQSWTTLDGDVFDGESGERVGKVSCRFDLGTELLPLLSSFRRIDGAPVARRALDPNQAAAAAALARAMIPEGRRFRGGDGITVERACEMVAEFSPGAVGHLGILASFLDSAALLSTGRRFRTLEPERQERLLRKWERDPLLRWPLYLLGFMLKSAHFDDPDVYAALGSPYHRGGKPEPARWLSQVRPGKSIHADEELECEVVVVGTGAGGAVVAKELAERGHAVLMLEEGEHYRRDAFIGRARGTHGRFYRLKGSLAVGNAVVPVLMGRMVGGSTAVNTGTCFRTPDWVLSHWCEELGTDELGPERLAKHFENVERELQVAPSDPKALGGPARVVARGCDALGWHHFPVLRNAPGCDGQGVCDYGCPTDSRRSTNLSYVPAALDRGALLFTGAKAERVILEGRRAVGIEAKTAGGATVTVRARAVVLSGGAIPTPVMLLRQGIANSSGMVGKNLSLHPATGVSALFDEQVMGYNAVPQGYCCDEFHREGMLFLGASAPIDVAPNLFPFTGQRLMELMESYDRVASFGVMVEDEGRGRVRVGSDGHPRVTYFLAGNDVERLHRGMAHIAQIFLAAGARRIYPLLPRFPDFEGQEGLRQFRELRLKPWDVFATSFHPLGTCRMGTDPKKSVVGLDHQTHDVERLYIVDGSSLPGPTAVNPQISIMAFADRAAAKIAERLG